jgi:hypothetical protein
MTSKEHAELKRLDKRVMAGKAKRAEILRALDLMFKFKREMSAATTELDARIIEDVSN